MEKVFDEPFKFKKFTTLEKFLTQNKKETRKRKLLEELIAIEKKELLLEGTCFVCEKKSTFKIDFLYAAARSKDGQILMPNYRERLVCDSCGLNNRLRATYHLLKTLYPNLNEVKTYTTEELTPLYDFLVTKIRDIRGSEYFEGTTDKKVYVPHVSKDLHNEDLTNLSFANAEFDLVISCDVLEHIPDYPKALEEIFRVLKKGGYFIFSVPFVPGNQKTLVRAQIKNGKTKHILSPEYHGDPLKNDDGCLCFYHFGWDIIDKLKAIGFKDAGIFSYWSLSYGYLGDGIILYGKK